MPKKIVIAMTSMVLTLFPGFLLADIVLLKSGGVIEGEILSENEKSVKFKNNAGTVGEIDRNGIASVIKDEEELSLSPEELYAKKVKFVPVGNAKVHYELGLFCVKNGLLDYAVKEFNRAKDIDPKYEKLSAKEIEYIDSVRKRAQEIFEAANKLKESVLSIGQITDEFQKGGLPVPSGSKDVDSIVSIINSAGKKETGKEYAVRYLRLGDDHAGKVKTAEADSYTYDAYSAAYFCYEIAYRGAKDPQTSSLAQKKIADIKDKLEKMKTVKIAVPYSGLDKDAIILFIKGLALTEAGKNSRFATYYYLGKEFKAKAEEQKKLSGEHDRKNIETALYCFEVAKIGNDRDVLYKGSVEAKIKECEEALKNMKE